MKEIQDFTLFHWNPLPRPAFFQEMEFYHCRSRRSYRMRTPQIGPLDDLLYTNCICEVHLLREAHYMRRKASFLSIEYVKEGTLLVRQRGRAWHLSAGEIFIMQPQIESEFLSGPSGCLKISAMIRGKLLPQYIQESGLHEIDVLPRGNVLHLENLFQELGALSEESLKDKEGSNMRLTLELLQTLRCYHLNQQFPRELIELCSECEEHPERRWTQSEMAERYGCSGTHLVRKFRHYLSTTPKQYLLDLRMNAARRLLAEEELSIKEIAFRVGYENALNFSTEFKKRFGFSPSEFRKSFTFFS